MDIFDQLASYSPNELLALAEVAGKKSKEIDLIGTHSASISANRLGEVSSLLRGIQDVPPLDIQEWPHPKLKKNQDKRLYRFWGEISNSMQRIIWLLENHLTKNVFYRPPGVWDSHYLNDKSQTEANLPFFGCLNRFIQELQTRKTEHGTLMDNVTVLIGSEFGRFPKLNSYAGKDHFPESPFILFGKGVRSGEIWGSLGRKMEGLRISGLDGKRDKNGHKVTLDDLGTTLLFMAGINPRRYGYSGNVLRFIYS